MADGLSTCWTVIRGAAEGSDADRTVFVTRYAPVIRAYLAARWRGSILLQNVDDAVQDVFLACLRAEGVLTRADAGRAGGFRPFLYGVVRNVARETEKRRSRSRERRMDTGFVEAVAAPEDVTLERAFDRAWAVAVMRTAADAHRREAEAAGPDAVRRVEILRLRFEEGLPIRDIAERWGDDPAHVHREYAKSRREFEAALVDVMLFHHPGSRARARDEARKLLAALAA